MNENNSPEEQTNQKENLSSEINQTSSSPTTKNKVMSSKAIRLTMIITLFIILAVIFQQGKKALRNQKQDPEIATS